ncbi:DUF4145 domain-containing protein [Pseudomonas aeruginosa]|nr:DUF4145 domain-containing protein [Pseudomonas aeruginosa]HBO5664190.1 DUF4145 domain-containing protein [Pseudomonas aeruginosa]
MSTPYTPPKFWLGSFNCPYANCGAFAHMAWSRFNNGTADAFCPACKQRSIWRYWELDNDLLSEENHYEGEMLYPHVTLAPPPHPDMPEDVKKDYEEARLVVTHSPRAAAALLRLCVQKICEELLKTPGDINQQIKTLVENGLPAKVQKALDSVRVIGNEAVHPGTMDLNDTPELALVLFRLLNLIVQDCITAPQEADDIYDMLPERKLRGIEQRDAAAKARQSNECDG